MRQRRFGVVLASLLFAVEAGIDDLYRVVIVLVMTVAATAAMYLACVALLATLAAAGRSHRLRRWLFAITPGRLGRWLAGLALLGGLSPTPAHGDTQPSFPTSTVSDTVADDAKQFIERLGLPPAELLDDEGTPVNSDVYMVVSGDSFWHIAKRHVLNHDSAATVRDIAVYWLTLVDMNLDELVVAGDPDLLFPGQQLQLPPVTIVGSS